MSAHFLKAEKKSSLGFLSEQLQKIKWTNQLSKKVQVAGAIQARENHVTIKVALEVLFQCRLTVA